MQGRNRDTDIENNIWTARGERGMGGRMNWEIGIDIYTLTNMYKIGN